MPKCPVCGKWFRSNKGLKVHIRRKHSYSKLFGDPERKARKGRKR